ncbi:addiction module antitoxin RelB [Duganella caerulea]|uniref:type II toxin-antitoxin system RelE/ParE family toxin n=1 Tax=Duganella caerulea TaxID=2885762 RepID=UPI0030E7B7EE
MQILRYTPDNVRVPFSAWLDGLRDKTAQARIRFRLRQLENGNFGDVAPVGRGVLEMRIHVGAGYRLYYGRHGDAVVVLLCGGGKRGQAADIKTAKIYWADWKRRQK